MDTQIIKKKQQIHLIMQNDVFKVNNEIIFDLYERKNEEKFDQRLRAFVNPTINKIDHNAMMLDMNERMASNIDEQCVKDTNYLYGQGQQNPAYAYTQLPQYQAHIHHIDPSSEDQQNIFNDYDFIRF
ncbi:unnamed protein product [Rotaria magnacalcarata]|uniref:Uncharacterized protein n=2 Tax=Rotaria magnacalcarata TaxID=392030 RepID=A0A8S3JEC2_9BILA|nr:unnamed protein product [Rotaria magnacalcarata]CAF5218177.1 unnamed protein product [Rotaria magnacalcarata]